MSNKIIELTKLILGLILLLFPVIGGLIFYLEGLSILHKVINVKNVSGVFWVYYGDSTAASNTPIFLGLCGLAGAYLLANYKSSKMEQ
ncbi:hypothetical protein EFY79_14050 [Hanamia caeni]|jgi:hypothetical protein|uniref:Uncharacterized protein n=1 Tax=Hanamia caeni TaxID=2294116 RepID=A0A3M9NBY8_9BACT|nr:hypothetical protein [Hanamia caeni]RNI34807.1 hypothetical protein EFY79_14050 [Hanamia caeni]